MLQSNQLIGFGARRSSPGGGGGATTRQAPIMAGSLIQVNTSNTTRQSGLPGSQVNET